MTRPSTPRPFEAAVDHVVSDDAGLSMVELLVSIVLTAVIGTMITLFLLTTVNTTRQADSRNEQAAAARATLDSWSLLTALAVDPAGSSAPGAARFFSIDQGSARFCAALNTKGADPDADAAPIGARIALEGGQLIEQRWTSCEAMRAGATPTVRRLLVPRAALVAGSWLVTPLAQADVPVGAAVNGALLTSSLILNGTVTPTNLLAVVGVQVAFQVLPDAARPAAPAVYSTVTTVGVGS